MKRFMKGCGIAALVMIVLGVLLGVTAGSVAGISTISQVVDGVTGGRVQMGFGSGRWGIGWGLFDGDDEEYDYYHDYDYYDDYEICEDTGYQEEGMGVNFNVNDSFMFSRDHDVLSGDVNKYCPGSNIRSLQAEVGGGSFETRISEDGSVYLEAKNMRKFQGYVEDGTLYVKATSGTGPSWSQKDRRVILYLPENYEFDEVDLDMGAGEMTFDCLSAKEVSLEAGAGRIVLNHVNAEKINASVGAGQIELQDMTVGDLDVEVGMGELLADGIINGDVDVECSMGNVQIMVLGRKEDFNYQLEGAMGNIDLDGDRFGGFAQERSFDNGAEKDMDVECSMGNITISFRE